MPFPLTSNDVVFVFKSLGLVTCSAHLFLRLHIEKLCIQRFRRPLPGMYVYVYVCVSVIVLLVCVASHYRSLQNFECEDCCR